MNLRATFQAAVRDEWDGLERISRDLRPADFVTLANALVGLGAIVALFAWGLQWAAGLILVGILLDGVDGAVARLGFGGGPLGGPLDSLADAITFVAAPAVMLALLGLWSGNDPVLLVAAVLFAFAGLLRLARFEARRRLGGNAYFSGLSTPGGALWVVGLSLSPLASRWVLAAAAVGGAALMVSRLRYPKLRGMLGGVTAFMVLALAVVALRPSSTWVPATAMALLAFLAIFTLAGPFYVLARHGPIPGGVPDGPA